MLQVNIPVADDSTIVLERDVTMRAADNVAANNLTKSLSPRDWLAKQDHQMALLLGPMGIGKSTCGRLALKRLKSDESILRRICPDVEVLPMYINFSNGSRLLPTEAVDAAAFARRFCLMLLFGWDVEQAGKFRFPLWEQMFLSLGFSVMDVLEYAARTFPSSRMRAIVVFIDEVQQFTSNGSRPPLQSEFQCLFPPWARYDNEKCAAAISFCLGACVCWCAACRSVCFVGHLHRYSEAQELRVPSAYRTYSHLSAAFDCSS